MKRIFAQLITILLFPQVISAVILVPRPQKPSTVSQTYVVSNRIQNHTCESAPGIWYSHNDHNRDWNTDNLPNQARHYSPEQICKHNNLPKHYAGNKDLSARINQGAHRRLCQVH